MRANKVSISVLDFMRRENARRAGYGSNTTREIAHGIGEPRHRVYHSLRRLQQQGVVQCEKHDLALGGSRDQLIWYLITEQEMEEQ